MKQFWSKWKMDVHGMYGCTVLCHKSKNGVVRPWKFRQLAWFESNFGKFGDRFLDNTGKYTQLLFLLTINSIFTILRASVFWQRVQGHPQNSKQYLSAFFHPEIACAILEVNFFDKRLPFTNRLKSKSHT